ncbi:MAG: UvrD-helicase domain-containing protein, partial [Verrucomicrobiota bacterium]|nr:UvrD-helicase domain-containing protein [Verrucomicrobiota bacterium]
MPLTESQRHALYDGGDIILMAGAGTGKTSTLVARCIAQLQDASRQVPIEEILIVTFTDAAAAEVRNRLQKALMEAAESNPHCSWLQRQVALLDRALVMTLHGFCARLLRQQFHLLDLDPGFGILTQQQAAIVSNEVGALLFADCYAEKTPFADQVRELIRERFDGRHSPLFELIEKLHQFSQTLAEPERWFINQVKAIEHDRPIIWEAVFSKALQEACLESIDELQMLAGAVNRDRLTDLLNQLALSSRKEAGLLWQNIVDQADRESKKMLQNKFSIILEWMDLTDIDSLEDDWNKARPQLRTILALAGQYQERFNQAKRERSVLDFDDLQQLTLKLFWDHERQQPTTIADDWRKRLQFIYVDEYQDINPAQDLIIRALRRPPPGGNIFLVGDTKQSIYGFRHASPSLFQNYWRMWRNEPTAKCVPLRENFRSHESIINFINSVCVAVMHEDLGGIQYDSDATLLFGNPEGRMESQVSSSAMPRVEFQLRLISKQEPEDSNFEEENEEEDLDLNTLEEEALIVANRLAELKRKNFLVWDRDLSSHRSMEWRDCVILLRSPKSCMNAFARVFTEVGIPLEVRQREFFQSQECLDLVNLLSIIDNPLQDLPLIALLRSPFVGLSDEELSEIRLKQPGLFWHAMNAWIKQAPEGSALMRKLHRFLEQLEKWRAPDLHHSLAHKIETILDESHYRQFVRSLSRGNQRAANVDFFVLLARQFDQAQGEGLYPFLKFLEKWGDGAEEPDQPAIASSNSVRLMSIHQSKGLEFPVVVLAGLGRGINFESLKENYLFDEELGLALKLKNATTNSSYPSLPLLVVKKREKLKSLGEELRLLYVAMTRAKDLLIMAGSVKETAPEKWSGTPLLLSLSQRSSAKNWLDWIGPWLFHSAEDPSWADHDFGTAPLWNWTIHRARPAWSHFEKQQANTSQISESISARIKENLAWTYPFTSATRCSAKTSVTAIVRSHLEETDDELNPRPRRHPGKSKSRKLNAAEIGT